MSFLSLFGSLLHYPHLTQRPVEQVEQEGQVISRRLRELLEERDAGEGMALLGERIRDVTATEGSNADG